MQPEGHKLHKEVSEKTGCISTSKLHKQMHLEQEKASYICIQAFEAAQRCISARRTATSQRKRLKAVYKRVKAMEKENG
jgi:hypothetical protein